MKFNARLLEVACFAALVLAVLTGSSLSSFENDCQNIREEVLRLHVVANSDSKEDQELKLAVRDAILKKSEELFLKTNNLSEAEKAVNENLFLILQTAEETVKREGFDYSVCASVGKSRFPTKTYSNITLPAGEYDALKVVIGEGKGKNWWCVMFPPLCLSAAEGEKQLSDVLSQGEVELVESRPKYEIRFWIIEKFQELKKR